LKFNLFSEKTPPLVGVDISATAVKMVMLAGDKRTGFKLEAYATSPLSNDAVIDSNINDLEKVSDAIQLTWTKLGVKEKNTALALPSSAVISKKVMLPSDLSEDELYAQVEVEAAQYIPFPLDEINLDYQILGASNISLGESEVLIVASRKEKIEDRVAAAEAAGLKVNIMDVESFATEAAFSLIAKQLPKSGKNQTVMIVDIGGSITHINVIHNQESIYAREQNFGGYQLTQDIQRRYGLSLEESEISKRKGGLPESYPSEVLNPFMDSIAHEISRAQQFFTTATHDHQKIDHIVLAGGCAAIEGLDKVVEKETGIHTFVADPFKGMVMSPKIKQTQLSKDTPSLIVACGLAMRGLAL